MMFTMPRTRLLLNHDHIRIVTPPCRHQKIDWRLSKFESLDLPQKRQRLHLIWFRRWWQITYTRTCVRKYKIQTISQRADQVENNSDTSFQRNQRNRTKHKGSHNTYLKRNIQDTTFQNDEFLKRRQDWNDEPDRWRNRSSSLAQQEIITVLFQILSLSDLSSKFPNTSLRRLKTLTQHIRRDRKDR